MGKVKLNPKPLKRRCCLERDRLPTAHLILSLSLLPRVLDCRLCKTSRKGLLRIPSAPKRIPYSTDDGETTFMAAAPVAYRNATANVQPDCPLFAILPAEIRLIIFRYALSASYDVSRPFNEYDFYFRPGHRYDLKIDFTLLLTCRRIYNETALLPASINQAYFWYNRSPPCTNHHVESFLAAKDNWGLRRKNLQIVHLFTQQFWLEAGQFASWTRGMANMQLPRLKTLIITFRYSDWWWWEQRDPPCLDPKRAGQAQPNGSKNAADGFDKDSWGAQLRNMSGLKVFRLELERLASERKQLDAIVERASGWRFETADSVMVLQPSSTRRTAWRGRNMRKCAKIVDCFSVYPTNPYRP